MSNQSDVILVQAVCQYGRTHTLAEYQTLCRRYLEALREVHPLFASLAVLGEKDYSPISDDLSNLDQRILEVISDPTQRKFHSNSAMEFPPSPEMVSRIGFGVSFFSRIRGEENAHLSVDQGGIKLRIDGNSAGALGAGVNLILPRVSDRVGFDKPTTTRRLVAALLEVGHVTMATVKQLAFEEKVQQPGDFYSGQWLLYLPFPDLGACLPDDIHWEPFHKGILIETTPHLPDADNPADVAAGKRVREVLDEFGFAWQSTYAIHGWPPDAEEERYAQFITGAPPNRKYCVRCIDFDGYDSERDVLLYAKLFRHMRRHPKEWGLRGRDGPLINEARRQVRAANGTPIEWHIGLEEPAEHARTLLAEYTDITERQMKIIHTPIPESLRDPSGTELQP